jgi:adenylosuccinate synthase
MKGGVEDIMRAVAVIGANFGDEGKGLITDYLSTPTSMVVRSSGGSNAGHTVVRDGKRHIFRHVGSGALKGAATFLSEYFINNPILYFKELEILKGIGVEPLVFADPGGMVTTPWDMMINTILEESRGGHRHGSCGVGINETMKRNTGFHPFRVIHLFDARNICRYIMSDYVPNRLRELELEPSPVWRERLTSHHILDAFVEECEQYLKSIHITSLKQAIVMNGSDDIVFEGAQGLLLDQDHYWFPHVTHSKTGLHNVLEIAKQNDGIGEIAVVYVSRAYATRHGAGPFPREHLSLSYEDETNVPNRWQGSLRFGHLDLSLLAQSIRHDLWAFQGKPILAMTCLDQVADPVEFWQDGMLQSEPRVVMVRRACASIEAKQSLISFGPSAKDVIPFKY